MRLTVGSLPPAVYWRRRAVVLGVLLVVVIILWSSCSGPSKSDAGASRTGATTSPSASPSASTGFLTPTITTGPSDAPSSAPPSMPPDKGAGVPQCADADLQLLAAPETASAPNGAYLKFFLRIKNVSGHPCTRDLGSDHQELYLQQGTTKVWSSDACNALHGTDIVTMEPNIVHEFNNTWTGLASNNGCTNRKAPGIGKYELFARLDTKISEPASVQLT